MKITGIFRTILIVLAATVMIVWFYPHPESYRYEYKEGRPWNYAKLIAPFDIPIHPDSASIISARDSLDAAFVPVYEYNNLLIDTIISRLPQPDSYNARTLGNLLRQAYATGVVDIATKDKINAGKLPNIRILKRNTLSEMSTAELISPRDVYISLSSAIRDSSLHRYFTELELQNLLRPNYTLNQNESSRLYDYEYLTLTADRGIILRGQTIIDKGTIVTCQDYTNLRTYEELMAAHQTSNQQSVVLRWIGQILYVLLLLSALALYFYIFAPQITQTPRSLLFIYALIVLFFLIAAGLNRYIDQGIYIAPMMIVSILMLVFFDGRSSIFTLLVLTLLCAGIAAFALEFVFMQFCAGCATIYILRELSRRAQLLRTSFFVLLVYAISYTAFELLVNGSFEALNRNIYFFLLINAALTSMAYVMMLLIEKGFGFISVVTLVELADINNPLLLRLSNECPGTFQHSIAVSNLASDAAAQIGANVQLVRAGALYHDIGKLNNPAFFTENQHGVNPHDALSPDRSGSIIIAHVKDGVQLAEKAALPQRIRDFISEHHGSGLAKYFYIKACNKDPEAEIDKALYTYPGPNPRSRETSVLMMADAVEAASRSLKSHTREDITNLVNNIINGQIADGLHDESSLEFRDVPAIKETFIKRLMTIYHSRIAYPPEANTTTQSAAEATTTVQ